MIHNSLSFKHATAEVSLFDNGRKEAHAIIHSSLPGAPFHAQLKSVLEAEEAIVADTGLQPVFKRYFLTDIANQANQLPDDGICAVSAIQQAPLDGTKVALWVVLEQNPDYRRADGNLWLNSKGRIWLGDAPAGSTDSRIAARLFLESLEANLRKLNGSLRDNCVRTWFMVRDVDVNYSGVVQGRNEVFENSGLTRQSHFIASTGIEGRPAGRFDTVAFNAVADLSLKPGQMWFLKGESHLNPTIEYGVAFERGTCVDYADRRHVYISGTASIDNKGEIVHPGNIAAQTERMLENIGVLLAEGGCGKSDIAHLIVYLRDIADYALVRDIFDKQMPDIPAVFVQAPVCRPGWLIETECMAVKLMESPAYAAF